MAGSRQLSVFSENEIVKCQGHVCLIIKIGNQFGSVGKRTKSPMWSLGSAEVVWGLGYQLKKSDGSFCGLWVRSHGRRSSSGKRETRYQLLTGLYRNLQQNHYTVDNVTGGRNEETYIIRLDANDIQTNTATQPMWAIAVFRGMILTFISLWMEGCKCDSSLQQFGFWSSWCFELSRATFSFPQGNV